MVLTADAWQGWLEVIIFPIRPAQLLVVCSCELIEVQQPLHVRRTCTSLTAPPACRSLLLR